MRDWNIDERGADLASIASVARCCLLNGDLGGGCTADEGEGAVVDLG